MHMFYVVNTRLNNLYVLSNKTVGPGKKSKSNESRAYIYYGGQSTILMEELKPRIYYGFFTQQCTFELPFISNGS